MVILTQCCNDEEKAGILNQARKVADGRQQVNVNEKGHFVQIGK